jgi:branched-chain amino acid transport system substrate-binding protein
VQTHLTHIAASTGTHHIKETFMLRRRQVLVSASGIAASLAAPRFAFSQSQPIKIGLITDYTGPYRDNNGPGEEYSLNLAIQDHNGGKLMGRPVQIMLGDNLNKADVATDIAKRFIDVEKVDMIVSSGSSVASLAVHGMARDKGVITMMPASAASNFTEKDCSPTGFQWVMDTIAYPRSAVIASGDLAKKKWFAIAIDNVFGETSMAIVREILAETGGQVVGLAKTPINTTDYASFITQAQASKADVVAFINAGADLTRMLKQSHEFGMRAGGQAIVCPSLVFTDLLAVGAEPTQGIRFAESFYWNLNDATRAFSKRFLDKIGRMPAMSQGHAYAAMSHWLQAVETAKTTEGKVVAPIYRRQPIKSAFYKNASIRPNGRVTYDVAVLQVKKPSDVKEKFDLADIVGEIPADKVFKPLSASVCKI